MALQSNLHVEGKDELVPDPASITMELESPLEILSSADLMDDETEHELLGERIATTSHYPKVAVGTLRQDAIVAPGNVVADSQSKLQTVTVASRTVQNGPPTAVLNNMAKSQIICDLE